MVELVSSIQLPKHQEVEIVLIRLADGKVVARTREEVEAMKAAEQKTA